MAIVKRAKRTAGQVARTQRRIWLVQTLFWPTVVVGSAVGVTIWVTQRKKRALTEPAAPVS